MAETMFKQIRQAITSLNPEEVRATAERPVHIALIASTSQGYAEMEDFLLPGNISHDKRMEAMNTLHRVGDIGTPHNFDLEIYEEGLPHSETGFTFNPRDPGQIVSEILAVRDDLGLALARYYPAFRKSVSHHLVKTVSKENALFSLATALPNVLPSAVALPWAFGEFASDTAFLTTNQIRMAFLMAAASDRAVGYRKQKSEIASIIASAFGWRALARELAGKIPFGGGLLPKAAIAYAGTYVVGSSIERYYRIGYGYSRSERKAVFGDAYDKGRRVAGTLLENIKRREGTAIEPGTST